MKTEKQILTRISELEAEIASWTAKRKEAVNMEQFLHANERMGELTIEINTLNWMLNK